VGGAKAEVAKDALGGWGVFALGDVVKAGGFFVKGCGNGGDAGRVVGLVCCHESAECGLCVDTHAGCWVVDGVHGFLEDGTGLGVVWVFAEKNVAELRRDGIGLVWVGWWSHVVVVKFCGVVGCGGVLHVLHDVVKWMGWLVV